MSSVESAIYLMVIAYPMVFIVMGLFVALTYLLNKAFPYKGEKKRGAEGIFPVRPFCVIIRNVIIILY